MKAPARDGRANNDPAAGTPAIVSMHDVMPETMDRVERLLEVLAARAVPPVPLLVVPGRDWTNAGVARLRELAEAGHELAAHGWRHRVDRVRGVKHRLHARLVSRRAAEHLALDEASILRLMRRSKAWFGERGLPEPRLYVPPAWALGPIRRETLARAPFERVECARGFLDLSDPPRLRPARVVGYETDTVLRAAAVRAWNRRQIRRATRAGRPLRIGIHPFDLELRLRDDLLAALDRPWTFVDPSEIARAPA